MISPSDDATSEENPCGGVIMQFFRKRFVARIFLTSFLGVHVPLLVAGGYVLSMSQDVDWTLLTVLTAVTVLGTAATILLLYRELKPVMAITRSLREYAETRVRQPVTHQSDDEIGELAGAADWAMETVDSLVHRLEKEARTDALTGLPNRRAFLEIIKGKPLASLALIDIDRFKAINDTLGHDAGDDALRGFARGMAYHLGPNDVLARWGGEEFILYLQEPDLDRALVTLEDLRKAIASESLIAQHRVTFSGGLVAMSGSIDIDTSAADALLYEAKRSGRNRVMTPQSTSSDAIADLFEICRQDEDIQRSGT